MAVVLSTSPKEATEKHSSKPATPLTLSPYTGTPTLAAVLYLRQGPCMHAPNWGLVVPDDPLEVLDCELLDVSRGGRLSEGAREPPPAHHHSEYRVSVAEKSTVKNPHNGY